MTPTVPPSYNCFKSQVHGFSFLWQVIPVSLSRRGSLAFIARELVLACVGAHTAVTDLVAMFSTMMVDVLVAGVTIKVSIVALRSSSPSSMTMGSSLLVTTAI